MLFDRMATLIEKHLPAFIPGMQRAALFEFPGRAHELLPRTPWTQDEIDFINETFFLPFPVTAIEDSATIVVFWQEKDGHGLNVERKFIECAPYDEPERFTKEFSPDPGAEEAARQMKFPKGTCLITVGSVKEIRYGASTRDGSPRKFVADIEIGLQFMACPSCVVVPPHVVLAMSNDDEHYREEMKRVVTGNVVTALEEIAYFNSPSRFVVEVSHAKTVKMLEKAAKKNRVCHSDFRPKYTLLTPKEIGEKYGLGERMYTEEDIEKAGRTVTPHYRRKHYRTLKSDRFTKMKGKSIIIPAVWVGESEIQIKNRFYRVRLDL